MATCCWNKCEQNERNNTSPVLRHLEVTKYRLNHITSHSQLNTYPTHTKNAQSTHACSNQWWLVTRNHNDQNFLERLSWRALLLNLVAGDLPGDAPLPPRGDVLGEKKRALININKCIQALITNVHADGASHFLLRNGFFLVHGRLQIIRKAPLKSEFLVGKFEEKKTMQPRTSKNMRQVLHQK